MKVPGPLPNETPSGLFLIQDPRLRSRILPLFTFATDRPDERVEGQGTTFRIDPFGQCATAFHVFQEFFELGGQSPPELVVKRDRSIVAMEVEGLAFGTLPIRSEQWRTISGAYAVIGAEERPLQKPSLRNVTELLQLSILPSKSRREGTPFLDMDLMHWRPKLGERVLAIGYPNLDKAPNDPRDNRPISQYMYGAYGVITDIENLDGSRGRPWPMIRVDADWPGGMSGGPVFNSEGNVVGVVSAGLDASSSTAVTFSGWGAVFATFASVDPHKIGNFLCYGIFDKDDNMVDIHPNKIGAHHLSEQIAESRVKRISLNHSTGRETRLEM